MAYLNFDFSNKSSSGFFSNSNRNPNSNSESGLLSSNNNESSGSLLTMDDGFSLDGLFGGSLASSSFIGSFVGESTMAFNSEGSNSGSIETMGSLACDSSETAGSVAFSGGSCGGGFSGGDCGGSGGGFFV